MPEDLRLGLISLDTSHSVEFARGLARRSFSEGGWLL